MAHHFSPCPRFISLIGLALSLFSLSSGAVADAPAATYSFTTLDVPGATSTYPASINASGQVAGYYFDGAGSHGFIYSNGTFTTLDVPGATWTNLSSINDSGQVAGTYSDGSRFHGFIATPTATDIPTLSQWALLLGGIAWRAQMRKTEPL